MRRNKKIILLISTFEKLQKNVNSSLARIQIFNFIADLQQFIFYRILCEKRLTTWAEIFTREWMTPQEEQQYTRIKDVIKNRVVTSFPLCTLSLACYKWSQKKGIEYVNSAEFILKIRVTYSIFLCVKLKN